MMWQRLVKASTESTVYIAFMEPKTQARAVELIYNTRPSRVNQKPIARARAWLLKHGYLAQEDYKLRNAIFYSTPKPFIQYMNSKLEERKRKNSPDMLSEKDIQIIERIWYSQVFRTMFKKEWLRSGEFNLRHPAYYNVGFKPNGTIIVTDALFLIVDLLDDIGAIATALQLSGYKLPHYDEVIRYSNLDEFISSQKKDKKLIEILKKISTDYGLGWEFYYKYILENWIPMSLPFEFAEKIVRAGRIELTVFLCFKRGLEEAKF